MLPDTRIKHWSYADLLAGRLNLGTADILLHCGFARPHCTAREIADSVALTAELFSIAALCQVPWIVFISSQAVYGEASGFQRDEDSPPAPDIPYGHAKLGAECILQALARQHPHLRTTSIRLGSLAGGQSGLVPVDLISRMTRDAIESGKVRINDPDLLVQRLDVRDAAEAIVSLLRLPPGELPSVVNLGHPDAHPLSAWVHAIADAVVRCGPRARVEVELTGLPAKPLGRLDTAAFTSLTGWRPQHDLASIVRSQVGYQLDQMAPNANVYTRN